MAYDMSPHYSIDAALVERARGLQEGLKANYKRGDEDRRLPEANFESLKQADLLRVLVPRRLGGHGAKMTTQLAVAAAVAKGCPATAWVQSLINITTWAMTALPDAGQQEVFLGEERPFVCGVLTPGGAARPTDGGYLVTGKWPYASGSYHANWGTGGVMILDDQGMATGVGTACMRMSDLTIQDTWKVVGMRGTGSNTLVAEDVFIPHGRLLQVAAPNKKLDSEEAADHWPVGAALSVVLVGPLLGMAEAVLELVVASAEKKGFAYTTFPRLVDSHVAMRDIGQSASEIHAAKLLAFDAAATIDAGGPGVEVSVFERNRLRAACGHACALLRTAVDRLVSVSGASSFAEASLVQRYWKDLNVASRHAFLGTEQSFEQFGRSLVGSSDIFVVV
ncbi:acyl-CoA dehydrogenase family protein [Caulobacter soli]|uniref:acyl-CoA dehydrogenase family protein n=1 Tax=Caulobacter soli TaxID=2708539 RepID=UPI0013ECE479|nr:acyl-CoA dehydrogenase family protein [Caulobacter soli]